MTKAATLPRVRRPRLYEGEVMKPHTVRTTAEQWAKFESLGGGGWLRRKLDETPAPSLEKVKP